MKEIRTIKMVEQTEVKFVANDGREFSGRDAERECVMYEAKLDKQKTEFEFAKLDAEKINFPFISWVGCNAELWRITLESKKDYLAMVAYFKLQHSNYFDCYVDEPKIYPCEKFIVDFEECLNDYSGDLRAEFIEAMARMF